jgi:hypothetical protein
MFQKISTYLVQTVRFRHKLNLSHESTSPFTIELEHLWRRIWIFVLSRFDEFFFNFRSVTDGSKQIKYSQNFRFLWKICLKCLDGLATLCHRYSRATLYPWNLISVHFQYVLLKIMCSEMHYIPNLPHFLDKDLFVCWQCSFVIRFSEIWLKYKDYIHRHVFWPYRTHQCGSKNWV